MKKLVQQSIHSFILTVLILDFACICVAGIAHADDTVITIAGVSISGGTIASLLGIPYLGKFIFYSVACASGVAGLATGLVALWHGLVLVLAAVASLPGCGGMQKMADFFKVEEDKIANAESKVLSVCDRLSKIPLPQKTAAPTNGIAQSSSAAVQS